MSIAYYLVDRARAQRFDIGTHRGVYHRAVAMALDLEPTPSRELFCLACAATIGARVEEYPQAYEDPDPWHWAWHTACQAANIYDFCEEAGWDVVVVNDCDDSIDRYYELPVTHSIYLRPGGPGRHHTHGDLPRGAYVVRGERCALCGGQHDPALRVRGTVLCQPCLQLLRDVATKLSMSNQPKLRRIIEVGSARVLYEGFACGLVRDDGVWLTLADLLPCDVVAGQRTYRWRITVECTRNDPKGD